MKVLTKKQLKLFLQFSAPKKTEHIKGSLASLPRIVHKPVPIHLQPSLDNGASPTLFMMRFLLFFTPSASRLVSAAATASRLQWCFGWELVPYRFVFFFWGGVDVLHGLQYCRDTIRVVLVGLQRHLRPGHTHGNCWGFFRICTIHLSGLAMRLMLSPCRWL